MVYDVWLLPDGRLDVWLSEWATAATGLLWLFGMTVQSSGRLLALPGTPGIYVADGCNGLTTMGLFVGFVVAYPGMWLGARGFCLPGWWPS